MKSLANSNAAAKIAVLSTLIALLASAGSAATINYNFTGTFSGQDTDLSGSETNPPYTGTTCTGFTSEGSGSLGCAVLGAQQFNASLGTLISVQVILNWNGSTTLSVTNNGTGASSSGHAETDVDVSLSDNSDVAASLITGGGLASHGAITDDLQLGCQLTGSNCYGGNTVANESKWTNLAQNNTVSLNGGNPITNSEAQNNTYTNSAILSEFTGSGNLNLYAATFTSTNTTYSGGNSSASQTTTAGITGEVIYTYASVPEPGTLPLIVFSLGALALVARKRLVRS